METVFKHLDLINICYKLTMNAKCHAKGLYKKNNRISCGNTTKQHDLHSHNLLFTSTLKYASTLKQNDSYGSSHTTDICTLVYWLGEQSHRATKTLGHGFANPYDPTSLTLSSK